MVRHRGSVGWLALLALAVPSWVGAQAKNSAITGRVLSTDGTTPVPGARISIVNIHKKQVTDSVGRFAFDALKAGQYLVEVSVIGFTPLDAVVLIGENERKDIEFRTDSAGRFLPTIYVEGEAQPDLIRVPTKFDRRMALGTGRFITRDDIIQRNPMRIMDMIRMLPGVRVNCYGPTCQVSLNHDIRGCGPAILVDEQRTSMAVLENTPPMDIEGVEIYRGPSETPPELNDEVARCGGAIVIWTRRGRSR